MRPSEHVRWILAELPEEIDVWLEARGRPLHLSHPRLRETMTWNDVDRELGLLRVPSPAAASGPKSGAVGPRAALGGTAPLARRSTVKSSGECRTPPAAPRGRHGARDVLERRCHVTLLFSDLCDYTPISESLDPEETDDFARASVGSRIE